MTIYKLTDFNGNQMPISNGNLLINGGFKINPRGKSSYSTNSTSIVRTVAMWRIQAGTGNSSITVTVNSDGTLTVTNNTSAMGYFVQAFQEPFEEGNYTASMNLLSKTGSISFAINDAMDAAQEVNNGFNAFIGNGSPSRVTFYIGAGSSMKIQYCKMEHGNIATAYFEEDEAIVQMRSSKYVRTYTGSIGIGSCTLASRIMVALPIDMYELPTITPTSISANVAGTTVSTSDLTLAGSSTKDIVYLVCNFTGNPFTAGQSGTVTVQSGRIILSCEP